ncbi:unnamed protein product [Calypogeia fissa]
MKATVDNRMASHMYIQQFTKLLSTVFMQIEDRIGVEGKLSQIHSWFGSSLGSQLQWFIRAWTNDVLVILCSYLS